MKRIVPVLLIVLLAIVLSIGVNYLDQKTAKTDEEIQTSQMEIVDHITITYNYYALSTTEVTSGLTTIELSNPEEVKTLTTALEKLDTTNYSDKVGLIISGIYRVDFENGTQILFDSNTDEYATLIKNEKKSLIKISKEFKNNIIKKVNDTLTKKAKRFETEKVTLNQEGTSEIVIEEKFAIDQIFENCKNIITNKNIDTKNFEKNFEINFNNGIRIEVYTKEYIGKLYQNETEELVKLPVDLVDLMENRLNNQKSGKNEIFQAESLTIEHNGKAYEITEEDKLDEIIKRLVYSKISHLNYLDSEGFKIEIGEEDYTLNINENQIVIYGSPTYASRQIVYQDGTYDDITLNMGLEELIKSLAI